MIARALALLVLSLALVAGCERVVDLRPDVDGGAVPDAAFDGDAPFLLDALDPDAGAGLPDAPFLPDAVMIDA